MRRPRAALLPAAVLLAAAACSSKKELANYRRCLTLRVGMTRAELFKIMGPPKRTLPYVAGRTLPYLKGRTAYEWPNPGDMPAPDHVSVNEASGKIESILCSDVSIQSELFIPPPLPSTGTVAASTVAASVPPRPR
ncbi:MAG: hypothetical protein KGM24_08155 [Elusimicrobia bacterium]|nr:hypothetical protein [Elusimicrobiota bacterium]